MSIGFFLWLIFTIAILGFAWWGLHVQLLQKRAWEVFASKYKLKYRSNKFHEAPEMEGFFGDFYMRAYEADDADSTGRKRKALAFEMELRHAFPFAMLICRRAEQAVFRQANLEHRIKMTDHPNWNAENLIGTENEALTKAWLIPERLDALQDIFSVPAAKPLFIAGPDRAAIILQMEEPLNDPRKINALAKRLSKAAEILEVPVLLNETQEDEDSDVGKDVDNQEESNEPLSNTKKSESESGQDEAIALPDDTKKT